MALILNLKGPTGATGPAGATGAQGNPGANGSTILNGHGAPANTLGNDGDYYIDVDTANMYQKVAGSWT